MPTLTNTIRTVLQGDARSLVQELERGGSAADRFARRVNAAASQANRTARVRTAASTSDFERQLEVYAEQEAALKRQQTLRTDLTRTQQGLTHAEVVATGAAIAFDKALGNVLDTGMQRQDVRQTFRNQFGAGGEALFNRLGQQATRTPFGADALRNAALDLREMGVEARDIEPQLRAVGNAIAFAGKGDEGLRRVAAALGQAQQTHTAGPLIQAMDAAGLRPYDTLREKLGLNRVAVDRLANSYGSAERFQAALLAGMREMGGGHAMEDRMNASSTAVKNFNDAVTDMKEQINSGVLPAFTGFIRLGTDAIRVFNRLPPPLRGAAGAGLGVAAVGTTLAASLGIPVAQAVTTWKLAQALRAGATVAGAAGAGGAAAEGGAALGAGGGAALGGGFLPVLGAGVGITAGLLSAIMGGPAGWVSKSAILLQALSGPGTVSGAAAGGGGANLTPAEAAHLEELKKQTRLLEDTKALQAQAAYGNATVLPFSQVPFARQMTEHRIHGKR